MSPKGEDSLQKMFPARVSQSTSSQRAAGRSFLQVTLWGLASLVLTLFVASALVAGAMLFIFGRAAPQIVLPNVKGMPEQEAEAQLRSLGLKMKVIRYEYSATVEEGGIISQSPYAGMTVRAGRIVRVVVSQGRRVTYVPKLVGLTLAEATGRLTERDLQVGEQERRASREPADFVLEQSPPPGTAVPRKSKVNLVLSGGEDFGTYKIGEHTFVFRTLEITVPQGPPLQLVQVEVSTPEEEKSFCERLARPGEIVRVDVYGRRGARVRVKIEEKRVFSGRL